jgi:hypothetical protein
MSRRIVQVSGMLVLAVVSLLTLSACNKDMESPKAVMQKAKEAIVDVRSGQVQFTASMQGNNGEGDLVFSGALDLAFDKSDESDAKADLHVDLSGNIQAAEQNLDGDLDFNFITVGNEYYVRVNEFQTNDQSLQPIVPFINLYADKWLRIDEEIIPQNIRELQGQDQAMELKRQQLEGLFIDTELFTVSKEYGVEKLNGRRVYHYGLQVNMDGFRDYVSRAAVIDGRELTMQEVEEAIQVLSYLRDAELYIDAENYYILKSVFRFSGEALAEESANLDVEIVVEGSDFNKSVRVEAPEDAEDFNPLNLFMGLGGIPTLDLPDEADGEMMKDVTEDDVKEEAVE